MKRPLLGFAVMLVASAVNAEPTSNTTDIKPVDHTQYCYYADVEYSAGSIMEQSGIKMQCVRKMESNDLVWQEYEFNQL
ncbi:DUF1496 domain-containing protein [Rheinheimera fenheensis]|uniref:DUF1496 domain-containing protein n=1 Tax=Rheinheimera fenheensis TaxID=3152295 RepID=UPI00325F389F